jgi:hypothetical protein
LGVIMLVFTTGCEQTETAAEKEDRELKQEVLAQLYVSEGRLQWDTEPLSLELRESLLNKLLGNTHMLYASWTVENRSSHTVKDLVFTFALAAPSGTEVRGVSTNTLYVTIPPKSTKTFERQPIAPISIGGGRASVVATSLAVVP